MSVIGSELKINVNVKPIGNIHLSQCDFDCMFFITPSKAVTLNKSELLRVDDDNYIARIDSNELGIGTIKMNINIRIPDSDFPDGYRTEIETVCTSITIKKPI